MGRGAGSLGTWALGQRVGGWGARRRRCRYVTPSRPQKRWTKGPRSPHPGSMPTYGEGKSAQEVQLLNVDEPRSVVNLVPDTVRAAIESAVTQRPDLFNLDEKSLWKKLRSEKNSVSPTDNRIRLGFWNSYETAQMQGSKQMDIRPAYAGVCMQQFFYQKYLSDPAKVAWMLCPPVSYEVFLEEALHFGLEELRSILELPNENELTGKLDTKLMELKAKIVMMLDIRKHGAAVQRIEQKSMNMNIHTSDATVAKTAMLSTMEDVEKRLKELERRKRTAQNLPALKDEIVIDEEN